MLGHCVLFVCFRSEKIRNLLSGKKTLKKKNIEPIFEKVDKGNKIKKLLNTFEKSVSLKMNLFFQNFFYPFKITFFW